jgi:S1-C subfamily serine protease
VKLDDRCDVATLGLAAADAAELEPADIAWGGDATPGQGARLESCGLGPDGRLAVNSGILLGYRGPSQNGAADWIDISGRARQGDSGGPCFDAKGQVVGVLWGTDNRTVTATQAGYLHKFLAESLGPWKAGAPAAVAISEDKTAAPACDCADPQTCLAGKLGQRLKGKTPAPQPPQVIVNTDPELRKGLRQIEGTLGQVAQNTAPKPEPPKPDGVPPWSVLLCVVAAIAVGGFVFYVVQQN